MNAARAGVVGLGPARVYGAALEPAPAGQAALACLASGFAHALIAAAFAAVWIAPWQLEEERRGHPPPPPPDPITWVEAEPGTDVPVADVSDAPAEALATPAPAPGPVTPEPATKTDASKGLPEATATEAAPRRALLTIRGATAPEVVAKGVREAVPGTTQGESPTPAGSVSGSPAPAPGLGDAPGGAPAAELREKAPDLAARFTKELPRYAADVEGWREVELGESEELVFEISLNELGRVMKPETEPPLPAGPRESALVASLRRAAGALVTKLALPGQPVGAGRLRLKVRAKISSGPERQAGDEIELSFSYDGDTRRGLGTFTLRSGRSVTFVVTVHAVEPVAAAAAVEPPAAAAASTPSASAPPAPSSPPP